MSKTVKIESVAQLAKLLETSKIVVIDCMAPIILDPAVNPSAS